GAAHERLGAVVDIHEDRVEALRLAPNEIGHVAHEHRAAGVGKRRAGRNAEPFAIPLDDLGNEPGYDDLDARAERFDRRSQRKTHAEPADEEARVALTPEALECERREGSLRAVHAAIHEIAATGDLDGEQIA